MALTLAEFNRLVAEHGPAMYRLAYRMVGDRHEAEDLVQEAYRSAWKSRELFRAGRRRAVVAGGHPAAAGRGLLAAAQAAPAVGHGTRRRGQLRRPTTRSATN